MMDCKKALEETGGDMEAAVDNLRKKGQKVSAKRAEREATEGVVVAKTADDQKRGVVIALNCETDFVAKNADFVEVANQIAEKALQSFPTNLEGLQNEELNGRKISDLITDQTGKIGEKIELSAYEHLEAEAVVAYNHMNNKIGVLVAMNQEPKESVVDAGKDVSMQIAAMQPVAVDRGEVDQATVDREMEIAREQIRAEGKPDNLVDKIAEGKLNKFYKENTLLNQDYVKDSSKTVKQHLQDVEKGLTVTAFKRVEIG